MNITGSLVLFNNSIDEVNKVVHSFFNNDNVSKLYIIDNSSEIIEYGFSKNNRIEYIKSENHGYGKSHNKAIRECLNTSEYHVVLNPDIYFDAGVLDNIAYYLKKNHEIGLLMPKILYPNNDIQPLCKLVPNPINLIVRRFLPGKISELINRKYELKIFDYNTKFNIPILSGCFMFFRNEVLNNVGIFDERFFMYFEDVDLSRRIHKISKTIYYPDVSVYHKHAKESYKNFKMLKLHIKSAIKYFNKWGWILDSERRKINKKVYNEIMNN